MCRAHLKLNQKKYVFGIQKGKVLGCLVYIKGIEANPDKINTIVHMKSPQSKKEVQWLTSIIAALNQFMLKLTDWSLLSS
jgi:hypothetical protein